MSLIIDKDLLVVEPDVFVYGEKVGTILAEGNDGAVTGTTLTSASVDFEALGVDEGHVATVSGGSLEVVARPGASSLTVSRPRMSEEDPMIPPVPGSELSFAVTSFERQIAAAQSWALGALGLDAHDPVQPLDEDAVVNADALAAIIALRTICDVFATAVAQEPDDSARAEHAKLYRQRLRRAMSSTRFMIDLNGDGVADAARRMSTIVLERSR